MTALAFDSILRCMTDAEHNPDSDWLIQTHTTPEERRANVLATNPGVFLVNSYGENAVWFATLTAALSEPPKSPEAIIEDAAHVTLAMAVQDDRYDDEPDSEVDLQTLAETRRRPWAVTKPGADAIAREHGGAPRDLSVVSEDREEFAESYATDVRREHEEAWARRSW